jgi:hypothetical protein
MHATHYSENARRAEALDELAEERVHGVAPRVERGSDNYVVTDVGLQRDQQRVRAHDDGADAGEAVRQPSNRRRR